MLGDDFCAAKGFDDGALQVLLRKRLRALAMACLLWRP